ncbi:hypothetical protein T03_10529 [Trichinella britovi]|uniref:PiggyBac transposable element-derived protein domain-containing protein n=1 Tax=Trichinella britovi TaxID=45882 RepID=A0A0V1ALW5_TRIBR|nr:hypothetical protein T03_10529 [Trichinella britovi]
MIFIENPIIRVIPIDATFKETASGSSCVLREPVEYFRQYFHLTLLNHIITESELEAFLGTLLKMGLVPKPRYSMYWSTELRCDALLFTVFPLRVRRGPAKSRPVFSNGRVG